MGSWSFVSGQNEEYDLIDGVKGRGRGLEDGTRDVGRGLALRTGIWGNVQTTVTRSIVDLRGP